MTLPPPPPGSTPPRRPTPAHAPAPSQGRDVPSALSGPPPAPPPRPQHRKATLAFALGIGALLGTLVVLTFRLSSPIADRRRPLASSTPIGLLKPRQMFPEVESRIFQVTEATGRVEAQRGGQWVLIVAGDVLTQDNLVRTGLGRAILKLGGTTEIELRDHVEIRLDSISRAGASLDLRRGKVVANVSRSGGKVAITSAATRTANEGTAPARFIVTADEHGRVAVATTEGSALFESAGRSVTVKAGRSTRADPGQPPADPEKISEEVFLSVAWPIGERREDKVPVTGRVEPGSVVRVNGIGADIDGAGHFTTSVPVRVGPNPIEVEVEDVSGRTKREERDVRRISILPPELVPVPAELWKK